MPYYSPINYLEFFSISSTVAENKANSLEFSFVKKHHIGTQQNTEHTLTLWRQCSSVFLCFPLCSGVVFFAKLNSITEVKLEANLLRSQQRCSRLKKFHITCNVTDSFSNNSNKRPGQLFSPGLVFWQTRFHTSVEKMIAKWRKKGANSALAPWSKG